MAALLAGDRLYGKHDEQIRTLIKEKDKLVEMGLETTFVNCVKLLDSEIRRLKEPECHVLGGQYKADKKMVKVYIPVQEYPDGNLIGRLIGKKGSTIQKIQTETCTRITIMDKGRECRGRGRIQKLGYLARLRRSGRYGGLLGNISDDDSDDDTLTDDEDKNSTFLTIVPDFISEDYQKINDCLVKATAAVKRAMLPELPPDAPCWTRAVDEQVSDAAGQGTEDKDDGGVSTKSKSPENKSGTTFHYEQDAKILLNRLHEMWKEGEMCDVVLDLGTEQIPAHRVVLSSLSPYFKTLLATIDYSL
ncbi:uncharacterized protein [Ptychodera flava]|uniref:uncharacterized protein n=1 Tax=Ptychodera flava TaxID=63121 RepID=UPI00396AA652